MDLKWAVLCQQLIKCFLKKGLLILHFFIYNINIIVREHFNEPMTFNSDCCADLYWIYDCAYNYGNKEHFVGMKLEIQYSCLLCLIPQCNWIIMYGWSALFLYYSMAQTVLAIN